GKQIVDFPPVEEFVGGAENRHLGRNRDAGLFHEAVPTINHGGQGEGVVGEMLAHFLFGEIGLGINEEKFDLFVSVVFVEPLQFGGVAVRHGAVHRHKDHHLRERLRGNGGLRGLRGGGGNERKEERE